MVFTDPAQQAACALLRHPGSDRCELWESGSWSDADGHRGCPFAFDDFRSWLAEGRARSFVDRLALFIEETSQPVEVRRRSRCNRPIVA